MLDNEKNLQYNRYMEAVKTSLEVVFKSHPEFLRVCRELHWGKIEVLVKDGKPVMISVKRDIKLD